MFSISRKIMTMDVLSSVVQAVKKSDSSRASSGGIRLPRLDIGFLFVGPRFRYGFFSPAPHGAKLASRYRVRWQLRPLGLPSKLRDMPVIQKRLSIRKVFWTNGKRTGNPPSDFETDG